jgi:hypothetical protein
VTRLPVVFHEVVEKLDFRLRQRHFWERFGHRRVDHRDPEHTPTQDANDRIKVSEPVCCSKP